MAKTTFALGPSNYRTIPHHNENPAVRALAAARAEWFWILAESRMDPGYLNCRRSSGPGSRP